MSKSLEFDVRLSHGLPPKGLAAMERRVIGKLPGRYVYLVRNTREARKLLNVALRSK